MTTYGTLFVKLKSALFMVILLAAMEGFSASGVSNNEFARLGEEPFFEQVKLRIKEQKYPEAARLLSSFYTNNADICWQSSFALKNLIEAAPQTKAEFQAIQQALFLKLLQARADSPDGDGMLEHFMELSMSLNDAPSQLLDDLYVLERRNPDFLAQQFSRVCQYVIQQKDYALAQRQLSVNGYAENFHRQLRSYMFLAKKPAHSTQFFADRFQELLTVMVYDGRSGEAQAFRSEALDALRKNGYRGDLRLEIDFAKQQMEVNTPSYLSDVSSLIDQKEYRTALDRILAFYRNNRKSSVPMTPIARDLLEEYPEAAAAYQELRHEIYRRLLRYKDGGSAAADIQAQMAGYDFLRLSQMLETPPEELRRSFRYLYIHNPDGMEAVSNIWMTEMVELQEFDIARKYMDDGNFEQYFNRLLASYEPMKSAMHDLKLDGINRIFRQRIAEILQVMRHFGLTKEAASYEKKVREIIQDDSK